MKIIRRMIVASAVIILSGAAAAHASTSLAAHSPLVTTRCFPAAANNHAAYMMVFNNKKTGTGWIAGYRLTAVTLRGDTVTRTATPYLFRIPAWHHAGWVAWLDPHRIRSCSFEILWGAYRL
jgi:hypothetical protein